MNTTIYIRKENQDRWESITDKSAWVNAQLAQSGPVKEVMEKGLEAPYPSSESFVEDSIGHDDRTPSKIKRDSFAPLLTPKNLDNQFCKHGSVKGLCKKGCK